MTPEAAQFLEKARECLRDSRVYHTLVAHIAGRGASLASYHAAAALLIERTGSTARTHRGLRAQFARIARDEPGIDRSLTEFLARAYELKTLADYATESESAVSVATAEAAIEAADRFARCIA